MIEDYMIAMVATLALLLVLVLLQLWLQNKRYHQNLLRQAEDQQLMLNVIADNHEHTLATLNQLLDEKHHAMLMNVNEGMNNMAARISTNTNEAIERLRVNTTTELHHTREALNQLKTTQIDNLAMTRETMLRTLHQTLSEQGKTQQVVLNDTMLKATTTLTQSVDKLTKAVDERLAEISGKVTERLDEGFKKTNQTFTDVMSRLAVIDQAQQKIEGLTTNVVSLQELLGDKRSRGAFGEVQLEALIRNVLPVEAFSMQHTFTTGTRADCALFLPEPTGTVAVDSKFPLENYHRMTNNELSTADQQKAAKQFKADVRKHIDDIETKYIIANETSDGAVMFIPAEAVFAELHAYHHEVIEYAMQKRVWVVSPTTLMAVLNTARAVLKDTETQKQVHVIKEELNKLSQDFGRFDTRMKKLADHIRQANQDAQEVHTSSQKISRRFAQIERVELSKEQIDLLEGMEEEE